MKTTKSLCFFILLSLVVVSCQKDAIDPGVEVTPLSESFDVPDIPKDIASWMTSEDIELFRSGPGAEYLEQCESGNSRKAHGRWYPVLMKLDYQLQIGPIGGESCLPGEFQFCVTPGGLDLECLQSQVGAAGKTWASGKWFRQDVYSEYFPVFCGPDFSGYGSGYYQLEDGLLFVEAQNGPFQFDEEGNSTFYRKGKYLPNQNTGAFEGAIGWEITIIQTLAEDNPENDPQGLGYSTSISFGWVYI